MEAVEQAAVGGEDLVEPLDARLDELRNILSSAVFSKSPRICSMLTFIVQKSIERELDSLDEQQIGIQVFNRPPGYNSTGDNIVRSTARSLRQRLQTYYLTEGALNSIRIDIPKGAYVAVFIEGGLIPAIPEPLKADSEKPINSVMDLPPAVNQSHARIRWFAWSGWITAMVVCIAIAVWPSLHERFLLARAQGKSVLLWRTMFVSDKPTFIVAGDAGLNIYEGMDHKSVDLNSYTQQLYLGDLGSNASIAAGLGSRFYTTMSDLQLVSKLILLPEAILNRPEIRFARDLNGNNVKNANLILIGTQSYNPWIELYQSNLSLRMSWDANQDVFSVVNRTPKASEQPLYQWTLKNGTKGGLTVISLTDNPQGSGRVLLIEGATMAGIYAASDFLTNKVLIDPILTKAKRSDGSLRNFDVLLQSDYIREGVTNLHVLAAHIN